MTGWWARQDSNLQPDRYERPALTIELQAPPRAAERAAGNGAAIVYRHDSDTAMPGWDPRTGFHQAPRLPTTSVASFVIERLRLKMKLAGVAWAGLLLFAGAAAAQEGGKAITKTTISLGTATPGGGFPVYGNAFAEILNAADPALSIEPRNTKGSNENIPLLESDQLDIALVAGEPSYEAFMGIGRAPTKLKILTAMYSSPGMFVVRADSPYKTAL